MTDYPELYRRLAKEIVKYDGKLDGGANAFVSRLIANLQAEGWHIGPEAEQSLTDYLDNAQTAIKTAITGALATVSAAGLPLRSETVAKLAEKAFEEQWPDGLKLSERLWNWNAATRSGLTQVMKEAIRQGQSANRTIYQMQRLIERAAGGEKFKIVERYRDDWVTELWQSAQTVIHDPKAKAQWAATVKDIKHHIDQLEVAGTRRAAERLFDQMRKAVKKGNAELAARSVRWWIYDKQLYHLKRIARTEMATAAHRAVIDGTTDDELIIGYQWRLSASHPRPDICDYYANIDMGLGKGVWTKEAVPRHKAHPHCMCLLIARTTPIDTPGSLNYAEFISNATPERREQLLPKWARSAQAAGVPLERLIRPDGLGLIGKKEAARLGIIDDRNAYEIAKAGGDYSRFYERYKKEYTVRLERAIKSLDKTVAEHENWIKQPSLKTGADTPDKTVRYLVDKKWPKDIARNQAYKAIIEGILKDRTK